MQNPILSKLNSNYTNSAVNNAKQLKGMLNSIQANANPMGAMRNLVNQNPAMRQVMNIVERYGNNPKDAFYALAKEKGVNPDDVLNALRN